jgi:hypothetical protein
MKTKLIFAGMALLAGVLLALVGCEAEKASQAEITIAPSYAEVAKGGQVLFSARGWHDYTWSLSAPGIGSLSHTKGDTTVYTSLASGGATQTLTVVGGSGSSNDDASDTNSTSKTGYAPSASATIIHK